MMDIFAISRIPFSKPIDVEKEGYLKVISIGYTQSSNNRYRLNRMDDYLLTFVEEGEFIINNLPSEDRAYIKIKQGDIVLTLGAGDITKIGGVINGLLAVKN